MGICVDCIYKGEKKHSPTACRRFSENYTCTNLNNAEIDFITGETILSSCRIKNQFGDCEFFNDGKIEEFFYAWDNNDVFFTKSETPEPGNFIYNEDQKITGVVDTAINFSAWESSNDNIIYTMSDTPEIGDFVFKVINNTITESGRVEDKDDTSIKFDGINFYATKQLSITSVNLALRNPEKDFSVRVTPDSGDLENSD